MNLQRISSLKQFIEDEPENPVNSYMLAMEYYEENSTESLKLMQILLSKHPNYLPTYFKAAHLMWEKELRNEADKTFIKGIKLAASQKNQKTLAELKSAYQNFQFDLE